MGVADWRAWVAQDSTATFGGHLPTAPNPPGTPQIPAVFPGVLAITDQILGSASIPTYPNSPVTINALDPFYVGTFPTGYGWTSQREGTNTVPSPIVQRPSIPGLTSP
jgi:hypothetical protein